MVIQSMYACNGALKMFNKLVEKELGKEHPHTASSRINIGAVMHALGDNDGTLQMNKQSLTIQEKVFGKDHFHRYFL